MPQHSTSFAIYFVIELPRYRAVASGSQPLGAKKLTFLSASFSVTHWECMLSPSRQVVRSPSSASMHTTFAVDDVLRQLLVVARAVATEKRRKACLADVLDEHRM